MNVSKGDTSLHELSPSQLQAVAILASGGSQSDAAKSCGVHRVTVTRWANHHPAFIAEMNFLRESQRDKQVTVATRVTEKAIQTIEAAIDKDDVEVALKWLRISPPSTQSTSASRPIDSVEVVEDHRKSMPSTLDELRKSTSGEKTEAEAESDLMRRITGGHEDKPGRFPEFLE